MLHRDTEHPLDNQAKLQSAFKAAMDKLATLGQDRSKLIDCSDVIPVPKPLQSKAHLPAGLTMNNIEQAVRGEARFTDLPSHYGFFSVLLLPSQLSLPTPAQSPLSPLCKSQALHVVM